MPSVLMAQLAGSLAVIKNALSRRSQALANNVSLH